MLWVELLYFAISCGFLLLAAELVITTITKLAGYLKISQYLAAFVLMAVATSIPELFVGINSSLAGDGAIILGTVIGANLINLTIVVGIPIIISNGIRITNKEMKKDMYYMFIIAAFPAALMLIGGGLSRLDGLILILLFLFYGWHTLKARKSFHKHLQQRLSHWQAIQTTLLFAASIFVLYLASKYVVKFASSIALQLSIPPILIGLVIISIGTTLPELIVGISSARKKQAEIGIGDVLGSVVTNSTLVIGVAALIMPIEANIFLFLTSTAFMLVAAFIFGSMVEAGSKLYPKEGVSLIMLYVLFIIVEMNLRGLF